MNELLPQNASKTELAIDQVAKKATSLNVPIASLFNPRTCPVEFLGHLAWSLSVDEWDDNWSEQIKRQVCQNSVEIHRFKGTKHAIKLALNSLNASVDLVEWFENGGQPYTASLIAYVSDNLGDDGDTLLTPQLQAKLWAVVEQAKNVRTHIIDFKIGIGVKTALHASAHATSLSVQRSGLVLTSDHDVKAGFFAALASAKSLIIHRQGLVLV